MTDYESKAISSSINGDWKSAVKFNLLILKKSSKDVDALNRLSYAYMQINQMGLATKTVETVLKVDPYNPIAKKNNALLRNFFKSGNSQAECLENNINFIEDPGSSKLISLICPAPVNILAKIRNGAILKTKIRRRRIVAFHNNSYVGCFPDDLSRKYILLMNNGYKYEIFFKSFTTNRVSILFVEKIRGKKTIGKNKLQHRN